ncbi:unnamed protein product [Soboliphyme baturini]|uniref:Ubiquitinyl hydrolase 1 n=1 Tax=Soboliphyme baturini TaxID=241478 RepID=A0A183J0Y0_9BILA|nr:unnamed protein product [Soboliphyme baturini]
MSHFMKLKVHEAEVRRKRCSEHFIVFLNRPGHMENFEINEDNSQHLDVDCSPSSIEEIRRTIRFCPSFKSGRHDEIGAEFLKCGSLNVLKWIYLVYSSIWQKSVIPRWLQKRRDHPDF